jgi:hypothetical protein
VYWAELFTKAEVRQADDSLDWYESIDAFSDAICDHIVKEVELPDFHQLRDMANSSMKFHHTLEEEYAQAI